MILVALSVLTFVVIIAFMYYRSKESFVVTGKFVEPKPDNKGQNFTLQPINETYTFADPIPDGATSFDKVLSRFTDKKIPSIVIEGANFPEAAPYTDTEVENVVKSALARVKGHDAPLLDFISVEYAAKGVDSKKNVHYDIAFMVYDKVKNYALKLALVCIVDKSTRLWIKKLISFNSETIDKSAPTGVASIDDTPLAKFAPDFVPYINLYD